MLKTRVARDRIRQKEGRCEGRKPFGTRPGEEEAIHFMRALRAKPKNKPRLSFADIAAKLDEHGYPSRSGKPWTAESVRKILNR